VNISCEGLLAVFGDGFIYKDEKVAFSKKHAQFKTRVLKPYRIYNQNGQIDTQFMTKTVEKPYP